MQIVLFDGPVPGRPPGGSYGHSRLLSYSCVLCPSTWCPVTVRLTRRPGASIGGRQRPSFGAACKAEKL
jgi:hypothetical protein